MMYFATFRPERYIKRPDTYRSGYGQGLFVLSANSDREDKVLLLELEADDYVTKPFSPRQLLARVGRTVRRSETLHKVGSQATAKVVNHEVLMFGDARVDFTSMEATRAGKPVTLTARVQTAKVSRLLRRKSDFSRGTSQ